MNIEKKVYELDGETVDIADLISANEECGIDVKAIAALLPGESIDLAGGACGEAMLVRIK